MSSDCLKRAQILNIRFLLTFMMTSPKHGHSNFIPIFKKKVTHEKSSVNRLLEIMFIAFIKLPAFGMYFIIVAWNVLQNIEIN